jgi:hypothetical protein
VPDLSPRDTPLADTDYSRMMIADRSERPILYFPAIPHRPRFGPMGAYFAERKSSVPAGSTVYFDLDQILGNPLVNTTAMNEYRQLIRQSGETTDAPFVERIKGMLGDADHDGRLANGERATIDAPYVLWSAGNDGIYGPNADGSADDVLFTNFGQ